ncbi:MAG: hypothetical protein OIN84_06500 [Candidatus Methanoperedens sp.]|uniref:hypothetical protein n=1 Tax=Candidatus Methanoperedens sp. BLZ2 TaxID=2035255 RepID=UPI000BE43ACF|nr:hypothetical protein [Candidatus Methanoperedens sp. BLZ2]KAB2939395.1 MAG: hypothetical protein F9K14_19655 [Candidatus Methanoperedens sp.]MCX9077611.1 hypothetical protein [Candidatus Methanoperedens sp.]
MNSIAKTHWYNENTQSPICESAGNSFQFADIPVDVTCKKYLELLMENRGFVLKHTGYLI